VILTSFSVQAKDYDGDSDLQVSLYDRAIDPLVNMKDRRMALAFN
jgi:hypothetical protein